MKRVVVKIGSSSLIKDGVIDENRIFDLMKELSILHNDNIKPILVTSGAVAVGAYKLNVKPKDIKMKQACAAVGQALLMNTYENICNKFNLKCAQILVNHDDFENRKRMLNLENTLNTLIENDVIPIINENDALAVEEIMVGDNDTLAARIAPMAEASCLVLMSDIDGLYTDNPKVNKEAKFIKIVEEITDDIKAYAQGSVTEVGTGGMATKIKAAIIATSSGVDMIIMNAAKISNLHKCFSSSFEGTLFKASKDKIKAKLHWMLYNTRPLGSIIVDEGCKEAILNRKSLLSKGIIDVVGNFADGDVINIVYDNKVIAKGITRYNIFNVSKIKSLDSIEIKNILGNDKKNIVSHANDIVLLED